MKEMKIRIEMIAFDIENLDGDQKAQAVKHLEESLDVLKLGSFQQFQRADIKTETPEFKKEDLAETEPDPQQVLSYPSLYNGLVPTCSECHQTFPTLGTLDTHMKKLHNETYRENVSKSKAEIARKSKAIVSSISPKVEKKNLVSQEIEEEDVTSMKIDSENIEKEELVKKKLKKKKLVTKKLEEKKMNSPKVVQNPENQNQDDVKLFPCADCEKSFGNKNSLGKHKISHTDKYKCKTCGKGFSQNRDIENHRKNQSSCVIPTPTSGENSNIRGA